MKPIYFSIYRSADINPGELYVRLFEMTQAYATSTPLPPHLKALSCFNVNLVFPHQSQQYSRKNIRVRLLITTNHRRRRQNEGSILTKHVVFFAPSCSETTTRCVTRPPLQMQPSWRKGTTTNVENPPAGRLLPVELASKVTDNEINFLPLRINRGDACFHKI